MPDGELRSIAKWLWECRLDNRNYKGRDSAFPLERSALDALRGWQKDADSITIYVTLVDAHGHICDTAHPGWRGNRMKERMLQRKLTEVLCDTDAVDDLIEIIRSHDEY